MNYNELKENFHQQVFPSLPNEWEMDDVLQDLESLGEDQQSLLLQAIPAVWPISHSLCFSFLHEGARHALELNDQNLPEWLRRILKNYEEGGLVKARAYMSEADEGRLYKEDQVKSVLLAENLSRLSSYAKGISGMPLTLEGAKDVYTDTEKIFLPETMAHFADEKQNFLLYKLIISLQCALLRINTFASPQQKSQKPGKTLVSSDSRETCDKRFASLFQTFPIPRLAQNIFQLAALRKAMFFIQKEYPGLLRQTFAIRQELLTARPSPVEQINQGLEHFLAEILLPELKIEKDAFQQTDSFAGRCDVQKVIESLPGMYDQICKLSGEYKPLSLNPLMGDFRFDEIDRVTEQRIIKNKKKFETILSAFLIESNLAGQGDTEGNTSQESADSAKIQVTGASEENKKNNTATLIIDNNSIDLPEELSALVAAIHTDVGTLPEAYVSAAFGIAGMGLQVGQGQESVPAPTKDPFLSFDEWDYRRQGYRTAWCKLRQRPLPQIRSDFVARTLEKHRGALSKIRHQFEMMRTQEKFARRRRHGDDLDLDALIDSLCDQHAGQPASENVYTRLIRNERSISTLFLVDMSNSTEGWVGIAIKEALVLLCEALEVVGDDYGIYGFSGMKRSCSEVYQIKEISEKYGDAVKAKIGSISPKEYTRMGPPIRHMINHFSKVETKTRLLVLLSDGKPEDYDDYKGQYAIEDTKKALAEAKGAGIHPFCITIDRHAHSYLDYLFGKGNYIFVKNIETLPFRLSEIYRLVTR